MWEIRGFKPEQDVVKEDKVVELKPKKRKTRIIQYFLLHLKIMQSILVKLLLC